MCSLVPPFYVWQLLKQQTAPSDELVGPHMPSDGKTRISAKMATTDQQAEGNEVTVTGSMGVQGALYIIFIFIYIIYII